MYTDYVDVPEDVTSAMRASCAWSNGLCVKMRESGVDKNCCKSISAPCKNLDKNGCVLGEEQPLFCKLFMCREAGLRMREQSPDAFREWLRILSESGRDGQFILNSAWLRNCGY